ncbi:hypothetical protein IL306_001468 [Fusarium sp. DS 682]|nr:hypothetical protein IL306_001468 [Fusarium sp. DS 682]
MERDLSSSPPRCLSAEFHSDIRDHLVHYFGCLEFCDRKEYFKSLDEDKQDQVKRELRRIQYLRQVLGKSEGEKRLVGEYENSLRKWKEAIGSLEQVKEWREGNGKPQGVQPFDPNGDGGGGRSEILDYSPDMDVNARVILFKDSEGFNGEESGLKGSFPNQKIQLETLLTQTTSNFLHKDNAKEEMVRYFHFPANNMSADLSPDLEQVERESKNMVMFMPYLHWEMDRRREKFAVLMDEMTGRYKEDENREQEKKKGERREYRKSLKLPNGRTGAEMQDRWWKDTDTSVSSQTKSFDDVVDKLMPSHMVNKYRSNKNDGGNEPQKLLGPLLFNAAMLCEAMSNFRDKKLLETHLHTDPPLHPRRTLDQAYYHTLKSTKKRDRDQVVYRGTRANPGHLHKYDPETECWPCFDNANVDGNLQKQTLGRACNQCTENVRKVARVVMVDQLWMWILDEHTIITCFPKRYGHNREDQSGIHKSIRRRLENGRHLHINSAFDLALIIIDECCRTFFDRTKIQDQQPQVMDIFSEAICTVVNSQANRVIQSFVDLGRKASQSFLDQVIN